MLYNNIYTSPKTHSPKITGAVAESRNAGAPDGTRPRDGTPPKRDSQLKFSENVANFSMMQ